MGDATHPEEWRPVPGYEGRYEVSDLGRVRSLLWSPPKVLRPFLDHGYAVVGLRRDCRQHNRKIHVLVAHAFIGPRPAGMQVRHLDGSRDNRLTNLAYGTQSENQHDAVRHGTHWGASKTHCLRGHPFDEANTMPRPNGKGRRCRECGRLYYRKYYAEQRARRTNP